VNFSFSRILLFTGLAAIQFEFDCDDERMRCRGASVDRGAGFVPDRIRGSVGWNTFAMSMAEDDTDSLPVRSCAAEKEGRKRLLGVLDPLTAGDVSEKISSPFAEGPAEEKVDPFWDLLSVDELPDRFRRMYFSIASASRSRMRVAMGDSEIVGGSGALSRDDDGGDDTTNVPELVPESMLLDRLDGI